MSLTEPGRPGTAQAVVQDTSSASPELPTDERLRQVAMELFAARGFGGTSMADIARGVGVRKASLYNYYASKDDLLMDLLGRAIDTWTACSRPALEGSGSRQERLKAHLEAAVEFVARHPAEAGIVRLAATQIGGELGRRVQGFLAEQEQEHEAALERFLGRAMEEGEIPPGDPAELLVFWHAFVDGLLMNELLCPTGSDRYRGRLDGLWRRFWAGLTAGEEG